MSLYHKYRPGALEDVIGNEEMITALRAHVDKEPSHAFLISGPSGCGKTTIGRILARLVGAVGEDFQEIDSADFKGIDTIREIRRRSVLRPLNGGPARVWLIDECHKMTNDAQTAFLKALEDPPPHCYYILATTDPSRLIKTVRSRCQQFKVTAMNREEMLQVLRRAVRGEGASITKDVYEEIIDNADGSARTALMILEQVLAVEPEKRLNAAKTAIVWTNNPNLIELCRALVDPGAGWKRVSAALTKLREKKKKEEDEEDEEDAEPEDPNEAIVAPEDIRRAILGYCTSALLKGENDHIMIVLDEFMEPVYDSGFPGIVGAAYRAKSSMRGL